MESASTDTAPTGEVPFGTPSPPRAAPARRPRPRSRPLEATAFVVIGSLLLGAVAAGFASLYREFWGPEAFVERYVALLADGRAADALTVPGVAVDSSVLEAAGIPATVSDALLRQSALTDELADVEVTGSRMVDGVAEVTIAYRAGGDTGRSTFRVEQDGWSGLVPSWRFETTPLAVIDVTVRGSMRFTVNDFELDKRQVSPDGVDAQPLDPVPLLVFTPGAYAVSVDTAAAEARPVQSLAVQPLAEVEVDVQAQPTDEFTDIVSDQVHDFLEDCATQQVLNPTGCPFGYETYERAQVPTWSIVVQPKVAVVPNGAYWAIAPAGGIAHIEMDVQSIYDGSFFHISQDVTFTIDGTIDILADGSAAISIGSPDL
ncbi:hypothetical protein N8K70_16225 [Microbacterium betulae]|uniref:Uncharacterized protein n=1 Tax=Microbacterium betulae TaxID=2981139 RepID=A0AA97I5L4_9MICO|nr:hypothetical protein [Microbacterium sp. AB]WOF22919.1 hypothetical protein N8K70_16225 [Microbacterium sp. AB]